MLALQPINQPTNIIRFCLSFLKMDNDYPLSPSPSPYFTIPDDLFINDEDDDDIIPSTPIPSPNSNSRPTAPLPPPVFEPIPFDCNDEFADTLFSLF